MGARMQSLMHWATDYGRKMAIFQILFGQYYIWDTFGLGMDF